MSTTEDSTNKRPLEKEESAVDKKEDKTAADETSAVASEEQPAKKAKVEEKTESEEGKKEEVEAEAPKKEKEPADKKPADEKPAEDKPAEDKPAEDKPQEKPAEDKAAEEPKEASSSPPAPAAAASASAKEPRNELSEKDSEGRIRKPTNEDILLGRGKPFQNHPGNQRMLKIVDEHKERYLSEKRDKKRAIVEQVLDIIQKDGARFLKRIDHGEYWKEVESTVSFEKVSHALRSKVRRPEGFEVNQNNSNVPKGPLPILPEGAPHNGAPPMGAASLYNQQLLQQRGMFPDAAAATMGLGLMPSPFGLMPNMNMFNPNLMRGLQGQPGGPPPGSDLEQLVRSQMVDSLLRQRQQLDEALNDVAGGMRLPPNYK